MIKIALQESYMHSKLCSGVQSLHLAKNVKIRPLHHTKKVAVHKCSFIGTCNGPASTRTIQVTKFQFNR